jgi:hypothetical protein
MKPQVLKLGTLEALRECVTNHQPPNVDGPAGNLVRVNKPDALFHLHSGRQVLLLRASGLAFWITEDELQNANGKYFVKW